MSDTIESAYMNLQIPIPTVEAGPAWAFDLNACLTLIDAHDHSEGKGVLVTPDGLDMSTDLGFNETSNITLLRSLRLFPQLAALALVTDVGCLYVVNNELYYNDVTGGHQIAITNNGAVTGSAGTITGLPSGTASAAFAAGTFTFLQATSTGANMDTGSLIVRYPGSYPTPAGNYISIQAPSSLASGYAITLPALPASTTDVLTMTTTGAMGSKTYDQVGQGMTSVGANAVAASRTRATGATVAAGGVAISSSCSNFTTTSTSYVAVTNLSVTITTSGRPIYLGLIADGSGLATIFASNNAGLTASECYYAYLAGGSIISENIIGNTAAASNHSVSGSANPYIYIIGAGTYTFTVNLKSFSASILASIQNMVLVAYEI